MATIALSITAGIPGMTISADNALSNGTEDTVTITNNDTGDRYVEYVVTGMASTATWKRSGIASQAAGEKLNVDIPYRQQIPGKTTVTIYITASAASAKLYAEVLR